MGPRIPVEYRRAVAVVDILTNRRAAGGRLGDSPVRPDGVPKVQGRFAFSSDAWADGMLWGATLRSSGSTCRAPG